MKVFISSTFLDLQEYRRAAIDAVNRQQGQPLAMEFFGAQPKEPTAVCEEEVRACDVLVGIYAHRYGFVPAGQNKSITQMEYELARELGRPCLCFILKKGFAWNPEFVEFAQKAALEKFLEQIRTETTPDYFTTPEDFSNRLTAALGKFLLTRQGMKAAPTPHVVPNPEPYFTGREKDLQKLRGLLAKERAFVCIENAPGIGKTQMSLKAAAELRDLFPTVYFLDLGRRNATSPEAITDTLREVLGIAEPLPFEKLLRRVAEQHCLFILDNLETALWPPADENAGRELLREWVRQLSPGQALLATSRALPKAGETALNILPLSLEESAGLWQKLRPETPAAPSILRELLQLAEGYPLVIYLLSQRALDLPLPNLLQDFKRRRNDALHIGKGRAASMKASIALSYENLSRAPSGGRRLFHLLGFLPAGATAETLGALCGEDWMEACKDVRSAGLGLWNGERFVALPPLRDFASRLATDEELAPLFEFYLKTTTEQDEHLYRDELSEVARQWLQTELPNLHHLWDAQLVKQEKQWVLSLAQKLARVYQDGVRSGAIYLDDMRSGAVRLQAAAVVATEIGDHLGEANCIQSRGDVHSMLDEYESARSCYEKAEPIYREIGDRLGEANCIKSRGDVHKMLSEYPLARSCYEKAEPIYREIGARLGEANCIKSRGDVHKMLSEYPLARSCYEKAEPIYREIGDRLGEANCIQSRGDVHLRLSEYPSARACYEKAEPIYREIGARLGEANCIQSRGDVHAMLDENALARACYEKAEPIYREIGARLGEANCIQSRGDVHAMLDENALARACYEKAEPIYREIGDRLGEANCIQSRGDVHLRLSEYPSARACYEKAEPIYREIGDRLGEANCIKSRGDVHLRLAEYALARACYEKAEPIYREIGDRLGEANCIKSRGDVHLRLAEYALARACYEKAEPIYREIGDRLGEANCIKSRGDVHSMLDENALARACYEKAEPIYREIGDRLGEANCFRFKALLEIKEKHYTVAIEQFNRALNIATAIGDRFTQAFIGLEMAEPLLALQQTLQAQESLNRAISLFEAINRPDRAQQCREKLVEIGKKEERGEKGEG